MAAIETRTEVRRRSRAPSDRLALRLAARRRAMAEDAGRRSRPIPLIGLEQPAPNPLVVEPSPPDRRHAEPAQFIPIDPPELLSEISVVAPTAKLRPRRRHAVAAGLVLVAGLVIVTMLHWRPPTESRQSTVDSRQPAEARPAVAALTPPEPGDPAALGGEDLVVAPGATTPAAPSTTPPARAESAAPPAAIATSAAPASAAPAPVPPTTAKPAAAPAEVERPRPAAPPRATTDQATFDRYLEQARDALGQGQHDRALDRVHRAIGLRRAAVAFQLEAEIFLDADQPAQALEPADRAVDIAPRNAGAWLTKAMVHYQLKQYPLAKRAFERNLELAPNARSAGTVRMLLEEM